MYTIPQLQLIVLLFRKPISHEQNRQYSIKTVPLSKVGKDAGGCYASAFGDFYLIGKLCLPSSICPVGVISAAIPRDSEGW